MSLSVSVQARSPVCLLRLVPTSQGEVLARTRWSAGLHSSMEYSEAMLGWMILVRRGSPEAASSIRLSRHCRHFQLARLRAVSLCSRAADALDVVVTTATTTFFYAGEPFGFGHCTLGTWSLGVPLAYCLLFLLFRSTLRTCILTSYRYILSGLSSCRICNRPCLLLVGYFPGIPHILNC